MTVQLHAAAIAEATAALKDALVTVRCRRTVLERLLAAVDITPAEAVQEGPPPAKCSAISPDSPHEKREISPGKEHPL
jgi:hypothetical protein